MDSLSLSVDFKPVLALAARSGRNPLLTQASSGNISLKESGVLWIKASGKWLSDAERENILVPVDLAAARRCIRDQIDPADRYPNASVETALHVALPHSVVLHVHSVNTIAWAVRRDAPRELAHRLRSLRWKWIPYVASGLPLARAIEDALASAPDTNVFILANHGLVIGGDTPKEVEDLLSEAERQLEIMPRRAHPADYTFLSKMVEDSSWDLPDDDVIHALGTDPLARSILSAGLLYPCQAIFSNSITPLPFRAIPSEELGNVWPKQRESRDFLIVKGRGVICNSKMTSSLHEMLRGLAQVVLRIGPGAPLFYLTEAELVEGLTAADRYRKLAAARTA